MVEHMEGLWSVIFETPEGASSGGVVFLLGDGRIFGGDSHFYWTGKYSEVGGKIEANINVTNFSGATQTLFGMDVRKFSMNISGQIFPPGDIFAATGKVVENTSVSLSLTFTKRA